jgi:hypothetical protein
MYFWYLALWKPGMVAYADNLSTQEAEVGGSRVLGQPRLHNKTLSQIQVNKKC